MWINIEDRETHGFLSFYHPNFDPSPNGSRTGTVLIKLTSKNVFFLFVLSQQTIMVAKDMKEENIAHIKDTET